MFTEIRKLERAHGGGGGAEVLRGEGTAEQALDEAECWGLKVRVGMGVQ